MTKEYVILVDEQDNDIGVMEKMEAHQQGLLHRAFSVFIFNDKEELLLQQRALSKYHSGGLWTNTCCSHPRPNETIKDAANRRLFEEMGMSCELQIKTNFIYKTPFENGLTEHELDYVLIGHTNTNPVINKEEVESYQWLSIDAIKKEIALHPDRYTSWFKIALEKVF
ncbi:MAG: isopentenyl-diphosphate Delta-isomerase [Bacteroidetes bacterium]|nr:isopentenyl-diphosphate Delta-isomerase [Bacteroidota bacterium]